MGGVAPWLFPSVFGKSWQAAGPVAVLLVPLWIADAVAGPLSQTLTVLERQDVQLTWDLTRLLLVVGAIWGSDRLGLGGHAAVAGYSGAMTLMYGMLWLAGLRWAGRA